MSIRKSSDKDIFENVIEISVRMYGNGQSYSKENIEFLTEFCRNQLRQYFLEHHQMCFNRKTNRLSYIHTLVYKYRQKKTCLKRLQQFLQAKDRPSAPSQQDELIENITKDRKKLTLDERFNRICTQLKISFDNQEQYDHERFRQYARLDQYYKSETLTSKDYLTFVEQQHTCFNQLRLLSSIDILQWLNLNQLNLTNQEVRLAEICLFVMKEILLNLMDQIHSSTEPCQISDIFRRKYVSKFRRLPYSGRRKFNKN